MKVCIQISIFELQVKLEMHHVDVNRTDFLLLCNGTGDMETQATLN